MVSVWIGLTGCAGGFVEMHLVFECLALRPLRLQYAPLLFTSDTDTMRSFFGQMDHMQVFTFILDRLDFLYA